MISENITPENLLQSNPQTTPQYATFFERMRAVAFDIMIFIPLVVLLILSNTLLYKLKANINLQVLFYFIPLILPLYNIILLYSDESTLGKRFLRLKVISSSSQKLTIWQIIIRETIGKIISSIFSDVGYLWCIFDAKKQTWHDKIAGTYVIRDLGQITRRKYILAYLGIFIGYIFIIFVGLGLWIYNDEFPCGEDYKTYTNLQEALIVKTRVCALYLSDQNLQIFSSDITLLSNLRLLYLHGNQISYLPPEIIKLNNLVLLDLSKNQLSTLPPEIVKLQNLRDIYLNNNQFTEFPQPLNELRRLKFIGLGRNYLSKEEVDRIIKTHTGMIMDLTDQKSLTNF